MGKNAKIDSRATQILPSFRLASLLLRLDQRSAINSLEHHRMEDHLGNYIRMHRKKAALSQRELGIILGYDRPGPVSRHERSECVPPLVIAISYTTLFNVPIHELFAGLHEAAEKAIELRMNEFEERLKSERVRPRDAALIARKLEWLGERRTSGYK